jgi:hypothetical protein
MNAVMNTAGPNPIVNFTPAAAPPRGPGGHHRGDVDPDGDGGGTTPSTTASS